MSRHVGVDGDLDEVGADDVGGGLEDDGEGGEGGLELVGAQIGEQTAHQAAVVGFADDVVILRCLLSRLVLVPGAVSSAMRSLHYSRCCWNSMRIQRM